MLVIAGSSLAVGTSLTGGASVAVDISVLVGIVESSMAVVVASTLSSTVVSESSCPSSMISSFCAIFLYELVNHFNQ